MFVPCGKCKICRSKHSFSWSERLERERSCHPYCLFGTLTYSDLFLPKFDVVDDGFVDYLTGEFINFTDCYDYIDSVSADFVRSRGCLPVGSVRDCQTFIKRLREKVRKGTCDGVPDSCDRPEDRYLRYFMVCELGETKLRPHYHFIIFTSSKWLSEHAKSIVSSCWRTDDRRSDSEQLGIVDCQNVLHSASSYVASYLSCFVSYPKVYSFSRFKPFALFSKHPAIGSLLENSEKVQELFMSGAVTVPVYRRKTNELLQLPFTKCLADRLYPKIKGFNRLSDGLLFSIYDFSDRVKAQGFRFFMQSVYEESKRDSSSLGLFFKEELDNATKSLSSLHRLYSVLSRFALQKELFKQSTRSYIDRIKDFYSRVNYECLKSQFEFFEEKSKECSPLALLTSDLILCDKLSDNLGLFTVNDLIGYEFTDEDYTSADLQFELNWRNDKDYISYQSQCAHIVDTAKKNHLKNEYLDNTEYSDPKFTNFLKRYHGL